MTDKQAKTIDLRDALDKHLNARSLSKSISTLLQSKRKTIDYSPYYQRNYVWDTDKATFFIESILLGIEIPPLIMFIPANDKKKYEVIDGRQRFETLKRFFEGEFKLSKNGLRSLSGLRGLNFQHLDSEIQRVFSDTTIRIIEFSTIGEHPNQDELEDRIKKEIFWRYNSGITPLKSLEVQRAQHLNDNFTSIMEEEFVEKPTWLEKFKQVFFAKYSSDPNQLTEAECQAKIRELLVLEYFPINIYASTSGRRDTIEWLYNLYIENSDNQEQILPAFVQKVELLYQLFIVLKEIEWMIYQGVYWALVILEQNDIDISVFFDEATINKLAINIRENIRIFTSNERGFSNVTNQRFRFLADFFKVELKEKDFELVDFNPYLKNYIKNKNIKDNKSDQQVADIKESIKQLNSMRLNRPDAVTKTIEDLTEDMNKGTFLIRPAYQRQEVINIKKASGIIESMLLGIPLPTIFIYRHEDGICEVVDGQQRLLSILGFLGKSYKDNNGKEAWSKKNHYKLFKKITVLKELGGRKYGDLDEKWQDRIWDFELSVVYIDEKLNDHFDPIDLFIRLNNKPYPVKDHSFEMWNSYSERSIIEKIKSLTNTYNTWFYYRKDNKRMDNEELLTIFTYLSSKSRDNLDSVFETVDIYNWAPKPLTFRLSKFLISEWLAKAEGQSQQHLMERDKILASIEDTEDFIHKVELLTRPLKQSTNSDAEALQQAFNTLLGVKAKKRLQKPFYMLWFLLLGLDKQIIEQQAPTIAQEAMSFLTNKQVADSNGQDTVKDIFKKNVKTFWDMFCHV